MFALTQQFCTGTSERPFKANPDAEDQAETSLNERFDFENKFVVTSKYFPSEKVFVPPYFVPPRSDGSTADRPQNVSKRLTEVGPYADPGPLVRPSQSIHYRHPSNGSRSPSPEQDANLRREREATWSDDAHLAFNAMITSQGYVNRYRLDPAKRERVMYSLQHPGEELLNQDGSKDHQTKYQSMHWTLRNGLLYRKPESGRGGHLRRHLDASETWDVLTSEHLRSGHLGRDKFRKLLERRYIGYTLQDIMLVAKLCRKCNGKERKNDAAAVASAHEDRVDDPLPENEDDLAARSNASANALESMAPKTKGLYARKQTSNFMWP